MRRKPWSKYLKEQEQLQQDFKILVIGDNEVRLDGYLVHFSLLPNAEPINHNEALRNNEWKASIIEDLEAIDRNNTWELVKFPENTKPIEVKWVYKLKHNHDLGIRPNW